MNPAQAAAQVEVDRAHSWFMSCCGRLELCKRAVRALAFSGQLLDAHCREVQLAENSKHLAFAKLQEARLLLKAVSPKPARHPSVRVASARKAAPVRVKAATASAGYMTRALLSDDR
jgi:hypothetical protein